MDENKDLKTNKEEKNLVLVIENANTELKVILNNALMYGYNKSYTKLLVSNLIKETKQELEEMEAPKDIIHSTEVALKQTFLRQYTFMLTILEKSKKSDKTGILGLTLKKLKTNAPLDVVTGGGGITLELDGEDMQVFNTSVTNLRDFLTEVEEAAGARYVDYANLVQEKIIEIGDAIADGTLTELDSLGRHKSIRNMAEINVRYNLIVDDVKRMGKDVKYVIASSHPNASERCSWWQGKIFLLDIDVATREMGEYKGTQPTQTILGYIDGKPYYSLKQACENGFLSYNCQHRLVKYYKGANPPQYDFVQVEKNRNLTTRQRVLENRIRQYKAREVIANSNVKKVYLDPFSGNYRKMSQKRNAELMSQYWTQRYNALCKENNLPRYVWRTRITETERMVRDL